MYGVAPGSPDFKKIQEAFRVSRMIQFWYITKSLEHIRLRKGFIKGLTNTHVELMDVEGNGLKKVLLANIVSDIRFVGYESPPELKVHTIVNFVADRMEKIAQ